MAGTIKAERRLDTKAARFKKWNLDGELVSSSGFWQWHTLVAGKAHLGYHRKADNVAGQWYVRINEGKDTRPGKSGQWRYKTRQLGDADDVLAANGDTVLNFEQAKKKAGELSKPGGLLDLTVAECIAIYIEKMRTAGAKTYRDSQRRAELHILPDLGSLKVSQLTVDKIENWHQALADKPAMFRGGSLRTVIKDPADAARARRHTANKCRVTLVAALNLAFKRGHVASKSEWERTAPFPKVERKRAKFWEADEVRKIIAAIDDRDFRNLFTAAVLTGCRYGELRALRAHNFNGSRLEIETSKTGEPRTVSLASEGRAFFEGLKVGKKRDDLLLTRSGREWRKSEQARPLRAACAKAGVPLYSFHTTRHTWASLQTLGGAPLLAIQKQLGHTTTRMSERYSHLLQKAHEKLIEDTAPKLLH